MFESSIFVTFTEFSDYSALEILGLIEAFALVISSIKSSMFLGARLNEIPFHPLIIIQIFK